MQNLSNKILCEALIVQRVLDNKETYFYFCPSGLVEGYALNFLARGFRDLSAGYSRVFIHPVAPLNTPQRVCYVIADQVQG